MKIKRSVVNSFVVTAILLSILWVLCPVCFQNNDDKILMYLTAGFTTGTPEIGTVFGGFYYYGIIALLYRLYSGFAWYTLVELLMIALSLWIISYSFIELSNNLVGSILFSVLFLVCFLHFSTALQYTATAGLVAGAAACSMIASLDKEKVFNCNFIISILMLVNSFGIRKQFGIVGLSAVGLVLLFELFTERRNQALKKGLIVLTMFIVVFGSNKVYENASGITEYNDYYAQAGKWIDYPHLEYADDTKGIYQSVGWDETLYNAASNWFFMDENLTKDNFKTINEAYESEGLTLRDYYERAHNLILSSMIVNIQVVIWIVVLIIANCISLLRKLPKRRLIALDCLFSLFLIVSIYFLVQGRFPMRAYQALVFIFMIPSIAICLELMRETDRQRGNIAIIVLMIAISIVGCLVKPESNILKYTYDVTHDKYRTLDIEKGKALESYAISHPDSMFIYDIDLALPADPFQVYGDNVPKNLVFWGGWIYNTPMYWRQLNNNGFESLYKEEFVEDRVFFCEMEVSNVLVEYMQFRYPDVQYGLVDEIGDIKILKFSK